MWTMSHEQGYSEDERAGTAMVYKQAQAVYSSPPTPALHGMMIRQRLRKEGTQLY